MKACYLTCAVLLAVACAGCAAGRRRDMDHLERELQFLEDNVFRLESDNAQCRRSLESAQRENEALLRDAGQNGARRDSGKPARGGAPQPGAAERELTPPDVILPDGARVPPFESPPEIQKPGPGVPEGEPPPFKEKTADSSPGPGHDPIHAGNPFDGEPVDGGGPLDGEGPADEGGSGDGAGPVRQITLNRRLTGGHNVDGRPGDEGVMVVVEPLDEAGGLIETSGDISMVVLDPAQHGEASRVARWDFTAAEAAKHLQRTPMGDGLHFTMPWPHSPPVNRTLNLYVRYTTSDGRRLQAEKQIEIDPPGEIVPAESAWTRSPARFSESIADDGDGDVENEPPRGRAKGARVLPADGDGEADSADAAKTTRRGARRSSRWSPYR
ncbi:MAG TPA: hypothetical protein VMV69_26810 [Pirellulales bacterium]|nr:hypothetical protein [Pirellulales bacterium]